MKKPKHSSSWQVHTLLVCWLSLAAGFLLVAALGYMEVQTSICTIQKNPVSEFQAIPTSPEVRGLVAKWEPSQVRHFKHFKIKETNNVLNPNNQEQHGASVRSGRRELGGIVGLSFRRVNNLLGSAKGFIMAEEKLTDDLLPSLIAELIPALIQVESGGIDDAQGDLKDGIYRAIGCLQIWKIYVDDCNRIYDLTYDAELPFCYQDRQDRGASARMAQIYLSHYGKASRLNPSSRMDWLLKLAKIHHGGPNGFNNNDYRYVAKIKQELIK